MATVTYTLDEFVADLRTITSGRGQFSMMFERYAPRPRNVAEEVIKEAAAA